MPALERLAPALEARSAPALEPPPAPALVLGPPPAPPPAPAPAPLAPPLEARPAIEPLAPALEAPPAFVDGPTPDGNGADHRRIDGRGSRGMIPPTTCLGGCLG